MMIATAALGARDFAVARDAMAPLIASGERPTARMCLIMAELEEREHNAQGLVREWLSRGSRAPRDAVWVADGHWSKQWAPGFAGDRQARRLSLDAAEGTADRADRRAAACL